MKRIVSLTLLSLSFASAQQTVNVALDWTPNLNHIGMYVAQAKGFYKEAGIRTNILPYGSTSSSILVAAQKADIGISGAEDVVTDVMQKQPIVSVAAIWSTNTASFAVTKASGITRPREFDRKIYAAFGAPYEKPIIQTMIKKDGGKGEFKSPVLDIYGTEAVISKRADFVWIFDAVQGVETARRGIQLKTFSLKKYGVPDYYTPVFIAHRDQLNQAKLKAWMQATRKGYEYAKNNPKEAAQLMILATPKGTFPDAGVLIDGIEYMKKEGAFHEKGHRWGYQTLKKWTDFPRFLVESGSVKDKSGKDLKTGLIYQNLFTNKLLD